MKYFIVPFLISLGLITDAKAVEWNPNNILALDCVLSERWSIYPGSPLPLKIQQKGITPDMTEAIEREVKIWVDAQMAQYYKYKVISAKSNYVHINGKIVRSIKPKIANLKEQATLGFLQRITNEINIKGLRSGLKVIVCKAGETYIVYYNDILLIRKKLVKPTKLQRMLRSYRGGDYNFQIIIDAKTGKIIRRSMG